MSDANKCTELTSLRVLSTADIDAKTASLTWPFVHRACSSELS